LEHASKKRLEAVIYAAGVRKCRNRRLRQPYAVGVEYETRGDTSMSLWEKIAKQSIKLPIYILICVLLVQYHCKSDEIKLQDNILVVLAHPDDETLISGTLAKLAARGYSVTVAFATSGDEGEDVSGRGLSGADLAEERQQEARRSLRGLGIDSVPIFLKFPDSHVKEYIYEIKDALLDVFDNVEPLVVITFGPDGITDDWDHALTGIATDHVFDITESGKLLLHMAISESAPKIFPVRVPVHTNAINFRVDVSAYTQKRINSNDAHRTQFPQRFRSRWRGFVQEATTEEFIIARNRGGEEIIQDCFF
jgi:LmbE family N-acetylglucosaminyl deacetylase